VSGKVAVGVLRDSRKLSENRAVIFAIAQLSCRSGVGTDTGHRKGPTDAVTRAA